MSAIKALVSKPAETRLDHFDAPVLQGFSSMLTKGAVLVMCTMWKHLYDHCSVPHPTDIDECIDAALSDSELCPGSFECLNSIGSYLCVCPPGYQNRSGLCQSKELLKHFTEILHIFPSKFSKHSSENMGIRKLLHSGCW